MKEISDITKEQKSICKKYRAVFLESRLDFKIGVSDSIRDLVYPIHGLRHPFQGDTTGWYIWAGEYSKRDDFFKPIHVEHLLKFKPELIKYLGLGPTWRFLIAPDYEDVWQDLELLNV